MTVVCGGYWAPLLCTTRKRRASATKQENQQKQKFSPLTAAKLQLPQDILLFVLTFLGQEEMVWEIIWPGGFDYYDEHNEACPVAYAA